MFFLDTIFLNTNLTQHTLRRLHRKLRRNFEAVLFHLQSSAFWPFSWQKLGLCSLGDSLSNFGHQDILLFVSNNHVAVSDGEDVGLSEPRVRGPRRGHDGQRLEGPHRADGRNSPGEPTSYLLRKSSSGKTTFFKPFK